MSGWDDFEAELQRQRSAESAKYREPVAEEGPPRLERIQDGLKQLGIGVPVEDGEVIVGRARPPSSPATAKIAKGLRELPQAERIEAPWDTTSRRTTTQAADRPSLLRRVLQWLRLA